MRSLKPRNAATSPGGLLGNALVRDLWLPIPLAAVAAVETATASDDQPVLRTVLAVVTVLGLLGRHRQPALAAAWVAIGVAIESAATESPDQVGVLMAVIVSAFAVGGSTDRRDLVFGIGMLGLAITVSIALDPSDSVSNVPPTLLLFLALPAGLGMLFARRGAALDTMAEANDELRRDAAAAIDAERRRLSRELHDVVSHAVTLIAVTAEAGATAVRSDPAAAEQRFAAIADTSRDALAELQALLTLLDAHPEGPSAPGLSAVDALIGGVRASGTQVELIQRGDPAGSLSPDSDRAAYRVVQEALTNALRHTRSPRLRVEIDGDQAGVQLRVRSSGAPHHSSYGGSGRGLVGLAERVEALGGLLDAGPQPDGSFLVAAHLPRADR